MDLLPKIQSMLEKQFGLTAEQVAPERQLAELGIESLSVIEFMFELENEFGIEVSEAGEPPRTVADLVKLVEEAVAKKAQPAAS